jgi:hypothetical protein
MTSSARKFPRAKPHKRSPLEIKALVRHRDGYRCQDCGMTARRHFRRYKKTLDVHRLVPGSRYTLKGCITLCFRCHRTRHVLLRHGDTGHKPRRVVFHLPQTLLAIIDREAEANDRTRTSEIIRALRSHLRAAGRWPRSSPPPTDPS